MASRKLKNTINVRPAYGDAVDILASLTSSNPLKNDELHVKAVKSTVVSKTSAEISDFESNLPEDQNVTERSTLPSSTSISDFVVDLAAKCSTIINQVNSSETLEEQRPVPVADIESSFSHKNIPKFEKLLPTDSGSGSFKLDSASSSSRSNTSNSSTTNSWSSDKNAHDPNSSIPSSCNGQSTSSDSESETQDISPVQNVNLRGTTIVCQNPCINMKQFHFVQPKELQTYVSSIITQKRDFGVYVCNEIKPVSMEGMMQYRQGFEFTAKRIHGPDSSDCGVFLCQDVKTRKQFILKKIRKENKRLNGTEFLIQHSTQFLPKIYGIYKDERFIYIYEEYIEGGTLQMCEWNLQEIRQFALELLSAFTYMHKFDLVHGDVKLLNIMVRDKQSPSSLVVIDFESAKIPSNFVSGGNTLTYLPPWHERIEQMTTYDPLLKEADLWAIACVIIFFLLPSERSDLRSQKKAGVWNTMLETIQKQCPECRQTQNILCKECRKQIKQHIKVHGKDILHHHVGDLMRSSIDDPDWRAVKRLLEYLTHPGTIGKKTALEALQIVQGTNGCQMTTSSSRDDFSIHS